MEGHRIVYRSAKDKSPSLLESFYCTSIKQLASLITMWFSLKNVARSIELIPFFFSWSIR